MWRWNPLIPFTQAEFFQPANQPQQKPNREHVKRQPKVGDSAKVDCCLASLIERSRMRSGLGVHIGWCVCGCGLALLLSSYFAFSSGPVLPVPTHETVSGLLCGSVAKNSWI